MNKNIFLLALLFICTVFCSCITVQKEWNKNASNIISDMKKNKKDAMLFFTGSDWDEKSKNAFEAVNTQQFLGTYGKDFILYNVDIVRDEDLMPASELKNNYILFSYYNVGELPYLSLRNPDGDVYFSEKIELGKNPLKDFKQIMTAAYAKKENLNLIKENIKKSSGAEKTAAIDLFFQSIYNPEDSAYNTLREAAIKNDPENKSGLKGKFIFFTARLNADRLSAQKKYLEAAAEYKNAVESGFLEAEAEQVVWYNIAYLYSMSKQIDSEKIIDCLNNAINANPSSDAVKRFKKIIDEIKSKK